jgi:nucleoside-diphosphate-sugar epimerase
MTNDISIIGLGWLGLPLAKQLMHSGYNVCGSVTTIEKQQQLMAEIPNLNVQCWQANEQAVLPDSLLAPVMIITIPPGKLSHYFVALQALVLQARQRGVQHLMYISSTSVYGGTDLCDETSPLMPETAQAATLVEVEQCVKQAGFVYWNILRPSGLIGLGRYPGRFLSGKTLDGGGRVVNLVHQADVIGVITELLAKPCSGIFNLASPDHPTRAAFYQQACQLAGLPLPLFSDMKDDGKIICADKVETILGYRYQIRDLLAWLRQTAAGE